MKKLLFLVAAGFLLGACGTTQLYSWGGNYNNSTRYEQSIYNFYERQSPESVCELVCLYAEMIEKPGGVREVVPPGIYAEYGYLLLQPETAEAFEKHATDKQKRMFGYTDYGVSFHELGIAMLQKEIELYPEAEKFIGPLLKRLKG